MCWILVRVELLFLRIGKTQLECGFEGDFAYMIYIGLNEKTYTICIGFDDML